MSDLKTALKRATASGELALKRKSGRKFNQLRDVIIRKGVSKHASGSALICMGGTEVLCTAFIEDRVPIFLRNKNQGWVTAEYSMLPGATDTRGRRESANGKQSGRTQEIQRLIGRSFRAGVNMKALGERTITIDCDVLNANGGTRCASITGGWVALSMALETIGASHALKEQIAAVSCGLIDIGAILDLDYSEDSTADADLNFVLSASGGIIEIQGTAEKEPFSYDILLKLINLAREGIKPLFEAQSNALKSKNYDFLGKAY